MNITKLLGAATICLALGYYLGYSTHPKIETQTQEHATTKNDIVTTVKETTKTDGSKETTTVIVDHTKENKDTKVSQTIILPSPVKMNRASVAVQTTTLRDVDSYTATYERRLAGPAWVGVSYNTKQVYGLTIGLEF